MEPSPKHRPRSDPIINEHTEQVKYGFPLACTEVQDKGQNPLPRWIWLQVAFKKIPAHPLKTCWSWAQFQKGQPTLCKT